MEISPTDVEAASPALLDTRPEEEGREAPVRTDSTTGPDTESCASPDDGQEKPRIAIIIDDMGNQRRLAEQLLALDLNLTYSFLPHAPFTQELEEQAWEQGHDILVHMPMEATDPQWDPGPGTLYIADSPEKLALSVRENLALVPHAIGVNNHMGSRFTEDRPAMHRFLRVVGDEGLFFVDSMTSSASTGLDEAREMGIRTARRHVFLDNVHSQEDICRQLKELISIARKKGKGIGIGHPNEATLTALGRCRETLLENVQIVGIHELVE
jgi:polysaccharide deacetylase 2 family uncharacterized protein YibQ